jgi:agmatine/peptidylarginine deiminase
LTTSRCLLAPSRNPGFSRDETEGALKTRLGAKRVVWLNHGSLIGDDTDGHIDTLARFCSPDIIVYTACNDTGDPHYVELHAMALELRALRRLDGKPYRLVPLPLPAPCYDSLGDRAPATYANFLIINGAVLVPTYRDPADAAALDTLRGCFPDRQIVGIDCSVVIQQHGAVHCLTMQFPEEVEL